MNHLLIFGNSEDDLANQETGIGEGLWDKDKKKEHFYTMKALEPGSGAGKEKAKGTESVPEIDIVGLVNKGWFLGLSLVPWAIEGIIYLSI